MTSTGSLTSQIKSNWLHLGLVALGFAPLLFFFFVNLWDRPAYQFFPLVLVAAGMLAWRVINPPKAADPGSSSLGMSHLPVVPGSLRLARWLWLATVVMFLTACYLWSPWLGYISFLLSLIAIQWSLGGKSMIVASAPVGLMLLAILPPPWNWDQNLTLWLRSVAVSASNALLDWLQVIHAQDGNTILLPNKTLLVEEACSGINSFILCNSVCLFWCLWQRRPWWWWLLMTLGTSLFVVVGNIIRITLGAAAYYYKHIDLLSGRPHEIFGLILLFGYYGLIFSMDQSLVFLTYSDRGGVAKTAPPAAPAAPVPRSGPFMGFPFIGIIVALAGLTVFAAHLVMGNGVSMPGLTTTVPEFNLQVPSELAGWTRMNAGEGDLSLVETKGVRSLAWRFRHEGITATVSVDYPLDGFHNVKSCYSGNGWQATGERELVTPGTGGDLHAIKLRLEKPLHHAIVWHSVMDGKGSWLSAQNQLTGTSSSYIIGYRIQLITGGYAPVAADAEAECQDFFLQIRQQLARQMVAQLEKPAAK